MAHGSKKIVANFKNEFASQRPFKSAEIGALSLKPAISADLKDI